MTTTYRKERRDSFTGLACAIVPGFLACCYRPGYLDDDEWELLKDCLTAGRTDDAMVVVEVAIYRKVATEHGRAEEFDGEWPAKGGLLNAN